MKYSNENQLEAVPMGTQRRPSITMSPSKSNEKFSFEFIAEIINQSLLQRT